MTQGAIEKKILRYLKQRGEATVSQVAQAVACAVILPREVRGAIVSMLTRETLERTLDRLRVRIPEKGGLKSLAMIEKKMDEQIAKMGILRLASAKDQLSGYVRTLKRDRYD